MKHSRSAAYDSALFSSTGAVTHWTEIADDPNDPRAIAFRARTLRAAWRDPIEDRIDFILGRCRGRRVLDLGCVAHDIARMASPDWLHGRVAEVASSCLGVDILQEGVDHLNREGYDVVAHDLTTGPGTLGEAGPFDVIVAGELIEHVPALDMLFRAAGDLLATQGQLIITTPNPWAPHRVAAGQRGDCWENVDHIMFAFPSGVAELAERHGLILSEATTTVMDSQTPRTPRQLAKMVRRRIRGTGWVRAAFATRGPEGVVRVSRRPTLEKTRGLRPVTFVGETFVYVVTRRHDKDANHSG